MAKPTKNITPIGRIDAWKKMWATPRLLNDEETEAEYDEFLEKFVPSHMHNRFHKTFGLPKATFDNRFFVDGATFHKWETRLSQFVGTHGEHVEVTVIYASPDQMEAHKLRGERRRSLRDIVIDDWTPACAIVRTDKTALYLFVGPKMRGCIVFEEGDGVPFEEIDMAGEV